MLRFIDIEEPLDGITRLPNGEQGPAQGPYTPVNRYGDSYMPDGREPGAPAPTPIRQVQRQLGTEVAQTADLGRAYQAADRALGGWLPGGGTPNALSDTVRPVLDALPTAEVDPSLRNYYRDRAADDQQRGDALLGEAQQVGREINSLVEGIDPNTPWNHVPDGLYELGTTRREAEQQAALYGRTDNDLRDDATQSLRAPGESDRQMTRRFQRYREDDVINPDRQVGQIVSEFGTDPDLTERVIEARGEQLAQRDAVLEVAETTEAGNWTDRIASSEGMNTAEGPNAGALGCVYAVNEALKAAGQDVPWKDPVSGQESVYIPFVTNWITTNGGGVVDHSEAKPGDIVVWPDGVHMGILTNQKNARGDLIVLSNSSSRASMSWKMPLYPEMQVYRVPQLQN